MEFDFVFDLFVFGGIPAIRRMKDQKFKINDELFTFDKLFIAVLCKRIIQNTVYINI